MAAYRAAHPRYVLAAAALVAAAALALPPGAARAQEQVYPGGPPQTGGLSESARYRADLEVRLGQLENQIAAVTGRNEELSHAVDELRQRVDKLQAELEHSQGAAPQPGAQGAAPPSGGTPAPQASAAPPVGGTGGEGAEGIAHPGPGAPPRPLGTLPPGAVPQGAPPPQPAQTAALPPGTPAQQYDYAINLLLKQQDFAKAETAFKAFIADHPKDKLAGNAQYWLGETYYVRHDYQKAAFAFAEGIEKYAKGPKAPDSLLKLGMSLARLDRTQQACTAFSRLKESFPKASETVKHRAASEQQRLKCKG